MTAQEMERDAELRRIAAMVAAEVVSTAAAAAGQVAATAAQAAHDLARETRIDLKYVKESLEEIKGRLDSKYVTVELFNSKFEPIQKAFYWMVAFVFASVGGALLALVLRKP